VTSFAYTLPVASVPRIRTRDASKAVGVAPWLNIATSQGVPATATGDVLLVSGADGLRQRLLRRFLTDPGEYALRPDYGGGLRAALRTQMTKARVDALRERLTAQALADKGVRKVISVAVRAGENRIDIEVVVQPKTDDRPLAVVASFTA